MFKVYHCAYCNIHKTSNNFVRNIFHSNYIIGKNGCHTFVKFKISLFGFAFGKAEPFF